MRCLIRATVSGENISAKVASVWARSSIRSLMNEVTFASNCSALTKA